MASAGVQRPSRTCGVVPHRLAVPAPRTGGRGPGSGEGHSLDKGRVADAAASTVGTVFSARPCARRDIRPALLLLCLCASTPALAHRLMVFAAADGDRIEGSAYFAGGAPAAGAQVHIRDGQGHELAALQPAADGSFSYRAKAPIEHLVVAESADGHRAEWRVSADELAPGFAGARAPSALESNAQLTTRPVDTAADSKPEAGIVDAVDPALTAAIERAVERQLRPLRSELAAAQARARLQDLLGGVGYILGLAGLALWWRSRGARTTRSPGHRQGSEPTGGPTQ